MCRFLGSEIGISIPVIRRVQRVLLSILCFQIFVKIGKARGVRGCTLSGLLRNVPNCILLFRSVTFLHQRPLQNIVYLTNKDKANAMKEYHSGIGVI